MIFRKKLFTVYTKLNYKDIKYILFYSIFYQSQIELERERGLN